MRFPNVEIKAKTNNTEAIRGYLIANNADFKGTDEQTDTYFNVLHGRLKLREGNIENNLIYYERTDQPGPKNSVFELIKIEDADQLKKVLVRSLGAKSIVRKKREIYYIDNVKFHIDEVPGLGSFVEIEAGNILVDLPQEELLRQCEFYMEKFGIEKKDLIDVSYSDLLMTV